eukprot:CAMPEP_0196158076 /NCGR_PEP_ID=MMETSP0910-20130528/45188_1 /TAXON_ID=49265 /ORGANISM="Thalassiosira rotula, Strain GSO102" /LENGTH=55 /DNA_ID=CAMNT_0041422893 /DNA_START=40 /DNA_END=207 /DNA_ORIENTATION=-
MEYEASRNRPAALLLRVCSSNAGDDDQNLTKACRSSESSGVSSRNVAEDVGIDFH